jgi:hypothetical protein
LTNTTEVGFIVSIASVMAVTQRLDCSASDRLSGWAFAPFAIRVYLESLSYQS